MNVSEVVVGPSLDAVFMVMEYCDHDLKAGGWRILSDWNLILSCFLRVLQLHGDGALRPQGRRGAEAWLGPTVDNTSLTQPSSEMKLQASCPADSHTHTYPLPHPLPCPFQ